MVRKKKIRDEAELQLDLKLLRDIERAEKDCQLSDAELLAAKETLKNVRELHTGNQYRLRSLIRARDNDRKRPLFRQQELKQEPPQEEPERKNGQPSRQDLPGAAPGWRPAADNWQHAPVLELKLSGAILTSLALKDVGTIGQLVAFLKKGQSMLDLGLTEKQAGKLERGLAAFWSKLEVRKMETTLQQEEARS